MKELIATTLFGLENVLAAELESLGAGSVQIHNRAVSFQGDTAMMYRANYHLRTALRILKPLHSFPARNEDDIYGKVKEIEWEKYLDIHDLFAVDTVLLSKQYKHSGFVSQRVKDGIVDRFRDRTGRRPSVDLKNPGVRVNIHLTDTHCSVSLDSSGSSLHKRGYRTQPYKAPLNEVLAAGMILLSDWRPDQAFLNPMCGSGTLCIEAGMIARGLPGGACDIDFPAIRSAQQNLAGAGMLGKVMLQKADFKTWATGFKDGVIIMNPPYGERLEETNLSDLYKSIGDTLKLKYTGFKAWVLSGNENVTL